MLLSRRGGNVVTVDNSVAAGVRVVDQIIEQVSLSTISIDTEEGGVIPGLNGACTLCGSTVVYTEIGPRTVSGWVNRGLTGGRCRSTVGDEDHECRVAIS